MRGWLTDRATINAQKRRWEFMIRRWGGSPNIFAWDLMNEVEYHYGCSAAEIAAYITEMADFVRNLELEVWGAAHMLTVSTAKAMPSGLLGEVIYNHPALDFATTHLYVGTATKKPKNGIAAIGEIDRAVRYAGEKIRAPRPYFDSESGPIYGWIKEAEIDALLHHNMSWAHLASGGAGSGMRWPYTDPHYILPEMRDNLLGMARFAAQVDWAHFESKNVSEKIHLNVPGIMKVGCADPQMALLWLASDTRLSRPPALDAVRVEIEANFVDGLYEVSLWNTREGLGITSLKAAAAHGRIDFTIPALLEPLNSVAVLIERVRE
jgi:mannan endo-1,4-beta-mannosidase